MQHRALRVDGARRVAREQLERDQRRAAAGRALVVEPAREQLDLLAEAELADRAVGDRPLAVVGAARRALDLVLPLAAEVGELALVPRLREGVGLGRCLGESSGRRAAVQRARRRPDVARDRPEEAAGALLLEDVRRPAGDARAREHRGRERRRDLGDVEHDRRVVLDVRRQRPLRDGAPASAFSAASSSCSATSTCGEPSSLRGLA